MTVTHPHESNPESKPSKRIQRSYYLTREDAAGLLHLTAELLLASEQGNISLSDVIQALIRQGIAAHQEGGQKWQDLIRAAEEAKTPPRRRARKATN